MDQGTAIDPWIPDAPDPARLGLERKLDVLRAQLAACQEGRDPGEAGIAAWSGLERQSLRIAALEKQVAGLREELAAASSVRAIIQAHRPANEMPIADAGNALPDTARARAEIVESHRTLRHLGQALIEMTAREAYTAARLAETETRLTDTIGRLERQQADAAAAYQARIAELQAMCDALLSSTSWRLSRPVRAVGGWWKRPA